MSRLAPTLVLAWGLGCSKPLLPNEDTCTDANATLGRVACVNRVANEAEWAAISRPADAVDQHSITKWAAPYGPDSPLPEALFLNSNEYRLHWQMLGDAFPEAFPGMTLESYSQLVLDPERKSLQTGNIAHFDDPSGDFYGFTIWDDRTRPERTVPYEEVLETWLDLDARFEFDTLVFVPNTAVQAENAASWNAPFPIRDLAALPYEPYTVGVGFGWVRSMSVAELADEEAAGTISSQDILVLDAAPFDLAQPVSGTVTGTRQGELSHLNVRAAARGTPNCYVADAQEALAEWTDELVRFECGESGWTIESATAAEAEAWWEAIRPEPVVIPTPNWTTDTLSPLLELDTSSANARLEATATYGSKGTNLATLYQRIDPALQLEGMVVPFAWYQEFLQNTWTTGSGSASEGMSFADTLAVWHDDPLFLEDPGIRRERLGQLRAALAQAPISSHRIQQLGNAITHQFGADTVMVRFRSSSNAEDALAFGGAGLYESTSACVADSLDLDSDGPSHCDVDQANERSLERGLRKVWASLWLDAAWEERNWYGIDHTNAAMGVLVNTRSKDEQVNAVAFTGLPTLADDRTLINAQVGAYDVVSAEPGVFPERILVEMNQGTATDVHYASTSSQVEQGERVLDIGQATALAEHLWTLEEVYPIDAAGPAGSDILLDTEWKVLSDGRLVVKQIRPFLRTIED